MPHRPKNKPKILVFDSGLGGLTVFAEVQRLRPDASLIYAADNAGFPYGHLSEAVLISRVSLLMKQLIARFAPDLVVVACNTASTLVLPHLRAELPKMHFVGTVPAIKPAAEFSRSGMISVLATPGTVARDYTRGLISDFAGHCEVALVGSIELASLAEAFVKGEPVLESAIAAEIAPCFNERAGVRTDCVVLACTHYPLLLNHFTQLAPWPVEWIDPAPAIARRADHILGHELGFRLDVEAPVDAHLAIFTSEAAEASQFSPVLSSYHLLDIDYEPMPLLFA
jgi:glutamate racemase